MDLLARWCEKLERKDRVHQYRILAGFLVFVFSILAQSMILLIPSVIYLVGETMWKQWHDEDRRFRSDQAGWSGRIEECDDLMKPCMSSSGCETRPVRGEPAQAGSEPCGVSGNGRGDA